MKKVWIKKTVFLLMLGITLPTFAQEHGQRERVAHEIPSPESNARRISKEIKKKLQLTDKQYTKVYEWYLKEQKETTPADVAQRGNRPPGDEMERPPHGGGHGGPGMGGGMPPEPGNFRPGFAGQSPQDMNKQIEQQKKKREKAYKKLDKKMKKLLDNEQYIEWKKWEIERTNKESQTHKPHPYREENNSEY